LIGPFRTSPIGLVPKPNSNKFRMIQDLSFPRNHSDLQSVNAEIDAANFPTAWGTFDDTAKLILSLPKGCLAATFDISAAYRITPVTPSQQNSLCVWWNGQVWVDRMVMFGLASSAGVFGAIADMLVAIYKAAGFWPVLKWVDDFLVIRLPGQTWSELDFINLTADVGVPWSLEKLRPLASVQRYIGFDWDLEAKSVSLPSHKLDMLREKLCQWLVPKAHFKAKEAASLHGKLVHVSCIFPLIRPFLPSVARFANGFRSARASLIPPPAVRADIKWIALVLEQVPNSIPLCTGEPIDLDWWGDASTSFGVGITIGSFWGVWKWAPGVIVGPRQRFDIGWAEAIAVELALRLAIHQNLLSPSLFLVRSDNMGVVGALNRGRARNPETNIILKHIYRLQAERGLRLQAIHVPSRDNVVDALSRGDIASFLKGFPKATMQIAMPLPSHLEPWLTLWQPQW
jgi:hypothetical protein